MTFFLFADDPLKSNLVMAITGFGSLSFLDAAQSAITKGVYTDGMEPGGEPAFLAYQYLDFQVIICPPNTVIIICFF